MGKRIVFDVDMGNSELLADIMRLYDKHGLALSAHTDKLDTTAVSKTPQKKSTRTWAGRASRWGGAISDGKQGHPAHAMLTDDEMRDLRLPSEAKSRVFATGLLKALEAVAANGTLNNNPKISAKSVLGPKAFAKFDAQIKDAVRTGNATKVHLAYAAAFNAIKKGNL